MKLIRVTDTRGRVWHLNPDWILRTTEADSTKTNIEFAIVLRNHQSGIEFIMGMVSNESIEEIEEKIKEATVYGSGFTFLPK